MTCTVWVESLNTREDGREKSYRSCKKHDYHCKDFVYWSPFVRCFVYTRNKLKVKFMYSSNHTVHYRKHYIVSHAQNTTAFHPTVLLTGIQRLLVTDKGRSAFPSENNCQCQLQTSRSVSVVMFSFPGDASRTSLRNVFVRYKNKKTKPRKKSNRLFLTSSHFLFERHCEAT
jgi:hypothetical protein